MSKKIVQMNILLKSKTNKKIYVKNICIGVKFMT